MKLQIGGGFLGLLTLIFVIAKLWGIVDWSWWIVFLPIIISIAIGLIIGIVVLAIIIIAVVKS